MKNSAKGVTLVELLVVVVILAALSAVAVPRISQSAANAKKKACAANIDIINSSIEMYYAENGSYPADLEVITISTDYFPDGEPVCPVNDAAYPKTLVNNGVDARLHNHDSAKSKSSIIEPSVSPVSGRPVAQPSF